MIDLRLDDDRLSLLLMRLCCFLGAIMAHVMVMILIMLGQTSCLYTPCVEFWAFDALRWAWHFPLYFTPWAEFPIEGPDFQPTVAVAGMLVANAVLAVLAARVTVAAGRRAWRVWRRYRLGYA